MRLARRRHAAPGRRPCGARRRPGCGPPPARRPREATGRPSAGRARSRSSRRSSRRRHATGIVGRAQPRNATPSRSSTPSRLHRERVGAHVPRRVDIAVGRPEAAAAVAVRREGHRQSRPPPAARASGRRQAVGVLHRDALAPGGARPPRSPRGSGSRARGSPSRCRTSRPGRGRSRSTSDRARPWPASRPAPGRCRPPGRGAHAGEARDR